MVTLPSAARLESRSQTATTSARPECATPGMSWPVAMRPQPMCPTRMRLLGAVAPNSREGVIFKVSAVALLHVSSLESTPASMNLAAPLDTGRPHDRQRWTFSATKFIALIAIFNALLYHLPLFSFAAGHLEIFSFTGVLT